MKNYISFITLFISFFAICQTEKVMNDNSSIKIAVKEFFFNNCEIDIHNKLDVEGKEILDGSELGINTKGIYLIRTVYRTDGRDYLLFKNGDLFEILPLDNFKIILNRTINFLSNDTDEKLLKYIPELTKWYIDNLKNKQQGIILRGKAP
jgi:hypothetical protein